MMPRWMLFSIITWVGYACQETYVCVPGAHTVNIDTSMLLLRCVLQFYDLWLKIILLSFLAV